MTRKQHVGCVFVLHVFPWHDRSSVSSRSHCYVIKEVSVYIKLDGLSTAGCWNWTAWRVCLAVVAMRIWWAFLCCRICLSVSRTDLAHFEKIQGLVDVWVKMEDDAWTAAANKTRDFQLRFTGTIWCHSSRLYETVGGVLRRGGFEAFETICVEHIFCFNVC